MLQKFNQIKDNYYITKNKEEKLDEIIKNKGKFNLKVYKTFTVREPINKLTKKAKENNFEKEFSRF